MGAPIGSFGWEHGQVGGYGSAGAVALLVKTLDGCSYVLLTGETTGLVNSENLVWLEGDSHRSVAEQLGQAVLDLLFP